MIITIKEEDWNNLRSFYPGTHNGFTAGSYLYERQNRPLELDTDRVVFQKFGSNAMPGHEFLDAVRGWRHKPLDLGHIHAMSDDFNGLTPWLKQFRLKGDEEVHFVFPGRLLTKTETVIYHVQEQVERTVDGKKEQVTETVSKSRVMDVVHVPVLTPVIYKGATVWVCALYPVHLDSVGDGKENRGYMGGPTCVVVGYD